MQSAVFIQVFLSPQIFSRILRSFSCSPDRLMLEYLEMSFRIRLSHVVFSLPVDIFRVFTKAFSDLLAGVSEGKRSRWPNYDTLLLHIVRLHGVTLVRLKSFSFVIALGHVKWITWVVSNEKNLWIFEVCWLKSINQNCRGRYSQCMLWRFWFQRTHWQACFSMDSRAW